MKVTVYGIGYVGLVQAAVLAQVGHSVMCVDIDRDKIANLKRGIIPIFEPGLEHLVIENHKAGRLKFTTDSLEGVSHGEIHFIAVGTPPDETGAADIRYVLTVAETIAEHMSGFPIVVNKSTVPVGTAQKVHQAMTAVIEKRGMSSSDITVVSNPE
ncbi:MAG TPA: UDP-glucose 6-dehydrogenase, partial [Psychromonas sp.]